MCRPVLSRFNSGKEWPQWYQTKQYRTRHNSSNQHKTSLVQSPLTTLGQGMRWWAYSTTLPSRHRANEVTCTWVSVHHDWCHQETSKTTTWNWQLVTASVCVIQTFAAVKRSLARFVRQTAWHTFQSLLKVFFLLQWQVTARSADTAALSN